jgi:hypothetical protein
VSDRCVSCGCLLDLDGAPLCLACEVEVELEGHSEDEDEEADE